jgi:hypothetical protein
MKTLNTLLLIIILSPVAALSQRALTTDDVLKMTGLSSGLLSPDGETVIFGKRTLNWDGGEFQGKKRKMLKNNL